MRMRYVNAVDLFCGAGGTSTGLLLAAEELGLNLKLIAVNHWDIAIDTHSLNHPGVKHVCDNLEKVDPLELVPSGKLRLLVASPECTHFSNARGGEPMNKQSRATIKHVIRWCSRLRIENVLIENVREFREWGPLHRYHADPKQNNRPIQERKGEYFRHFITKMRGLGYNIEWRVLCAADYGDATTRERLFIIARRNKKVGFPEPTHTRHAEKTLFGEIPQWRAAREIIDWSRKGESIFTRKKPLSPNTMKRIIAGLRKFGGKSFVIGQQSGAAPRDVNSPLPTIAGAGAISFIDPFIVMLNGTSDDKLNRSNRSVKEPLPTIVGGNHLYVAEPFLVEYHNGENSERRIRSLEQPLPTQDTSNRFGLCEPFIITVNHGKGDMRSYSVDEPMKTITGVDAWGLVEPFLMKYTSSGGARSLDKPLPTQTTHDQFGLVIPELNGKRLDIRFRMLHPHELSAAMSFPNDYKFSGTRDQKVKQIGNAVPVMLAKALCKTLLEK